MTPNASLLAELRRIVGPQGYLEQAADVEPFLVDHRKLYRGATPLVLRPDSTEQVSAIMRLCNEARVGVVPVGGNTGYCGGATPSDLEGMLARDRAAAAQLPARAASLRARMVEAPNPARDPIGADGMGLWIAGGTSEEGDASSSTR